NTIRTVCYMDGNDKVIETADQDLTVLNFVNLVDCDALSGHRRDPIGYGKALEEFDERLPELLLKLREEDLLIITADHGNDPTHHGPDHTREYVPLLVYSPTFSAGKESPIRHSFADIGATIADNFNVDWTGEGVSFLENIIKK